MTRLGISSGVIDAEEGTAIKNMLELDTKRIADVMAPKEVVFALEGNMTADDAAKSKPLSTFSRDPVYN